MIAENENPSFEAALRELETIVARLENGQVPLEESLELLRRGMALSDGCEALLQNAEAALEQLVVTRDGELAARRLDVEDDDDEDDES